MATIVCENVYKSYKKRKVLNGLSFMCDNEVLFLAGKNGAGKTTFIRMALGMEKPDNGRICFDKEIYKKNSIAAVFDTPCLYSYMTCRENIDILCTGYLKDKEYVNKILENLNIDNELLHKQVGKCSFGQQHRISVAVALIRKPKYLFLDEPTIGLDPISWGLVRKSILQNKQEQEGCVIITGQDYFEMASFSDKLVVLDRGICKYSGNTKEFLDSLPMSLEVTSFDSLPAELIGLCKHTVTNNDGTKTYAFSKDADRNFLLKTINDSSMTVRNLATKQMSLKDAIYQMIEDNEGGW